MLIITGATKIETEELTVKFQTNGTLDEYEKKVVVKKEFIAQDTAIIIAKPMEGDLNATTSEDKTTKEDEE